MDKKNTTIGVILLLTAFAVMFFAPKSVPPAQPSSAQPAATASQSPSTPGAPSTGTSAPSATATTPGGAPSQFASINVEAPATRITPLSNEFIEVRLTNFGGAVRDVAFKKHAAVQGRPEPYVFNLIHEDPILALTEFPGLGKEVAYEIVTSTTNEVVYRAVLDGKIEVTRRYRLLATGEPGADPYRLHHETTFRNLTAATTPLPRTGLSVGTAALVSSSDTGQYLNIVAYDGDSAHYLTRSELEGGGIGSIIGAGKAPVVTLERPGQVVWAAAKNHFFASIYSPDTPGTGVIIRRIQLPAFRDAAHENIGLTGSARFELPALAPNGTAKLSGFLFVGPQEYQRLAKFEKREDRVLAYTEYFFNRIFLSGYVAPFLNVLMNWMHNLVGNWGVAIVLMTIVLKIVSLPFTFAASKSAKRMAKLQPLLQQIREKHKDNPQKQQQATMELFKTHRVNPVGGCIPILITMPLFIGFFAMLQSPAELRFQPFLWAHDLSAPDTIGRVFGLPINIMPLLMGATMYFQMRLTPTPSVDNMQMKMMRFMPVIFTAFCYFFSCALALYSTVNGLFTIGQQLIINRMKDPEEPAPKPGAGGKPMKNVTPAGKKLK
jgi:YidC/Oxa1 family membrane protein insertase